MANLNRSVFRSRKPNRETKGSVSVASGTARRAGGALQFPGPPHARAAPFPAGARATAARRCFSQEGRGEGFILDLYSKSSCTLIYPDFKLLLNCN